MKHHYPSNANENEMCTYTVIPEDISVDYDMMMISLSLVTAFEMILCKQTVTDFQRKNALLLKIKRNSIKEEQKSTSLSSYESKLFVNNYSFTLAGNHTLYLTSGYFFTSQCVRLHS